MDDLPKRSLLLAGEIIGSHGRPILVMWSCEEPENVVLPLEMVPYFRPAMDADGGELDFDMEEEDESD